MSGKVIIDDYIVQVVQMIVQEQEVINVTNAAVPEHETSLQDISYYCYAIRKIKERIAESVGLYLDDVIANLYDEFSDIGMQGSFHQRIGECGIVALDDICEGLYTDYPLF